MTTRKAKLISHKAKSISPSQLCAKKTIKLQFLQISLCTWCLFVQSVSDALMPLVFWRKHDAFSNVVAFWRLGLYKVVSFGASNVFSGCYFSLQLLQLFIKFSSVLLFCSFRTVPFLSFTSPHLTDGGFVDLGFMKNFSNTSTWLFDRLTELLFIYELCVNQSGSAWTTRSRSL